MSLVGKVVRVDDSSLNFVEFMYPSFVKKDTLFYDNDSDIIFIGKVRNNLKEYLKNNTRNWISTVGVPDVDLTSREGIIKLCQEHTGKILKEETLNVLLGMTEDEFYRNIKLFYVLGRMPMDDSDTSIFMLYGVLDSNKVELLKVYYGLLSSGFSVATIESSIMTFIEKSLSYEDLIGSKSTYYVNMLKKFYDKRKDILKALLLRYKSLRYSKEDKLVWLLLNL